MFKLTIVDSRRKSNQEIAILNMAGHEAIEETLALVAYNGTDIITDESINTFKANPFVPTILYVKDPDNRLFGLSVKLEILPRVSWL